MRIFGLYVFQVGDAGQSPAVLAKALDLSSFGFFQVSSLGGGVHFSRWFVRKKRSVEEVINFVARELGKKTGNALSVKHLDYVAYAFATTAFTAVVITDGEYPDRSRACVARKMLYELEESRDGAVTEPDADLVESRLAALLTKCQKPEDIDDVEKIFDELDSTRETLHNTIKDLLDRGEKLEDLADQSEDLGVFSREFLKKSESVNSCGCLVL